MPKRTPSSKSKSSQKKSRKTATGRSEKKGKSTGPRAPNAYLVFCAEQRVRHKDELDQLAPKEVIRHLGAEWRKLSASQRESYKSKAPAHPSSEKVESSSTKSQANKKSEHVDAQPSATKKKAEQSASRKATRAHEDHHEQSDASSAE